MYLIYSVILNSSYNVLDLRDRPAMQARVSPARRQRLMPCVLMILHHNLGFWWRHDASSLWWFAKRKLLKPIVNAFLLYFCTTTFLYINSIMSIFLNDLPFQIHLLCIKRQAQEGGELRFCLCFFFFF